MFGYKHMLKSINLNDIMFKCILELKITQPQTQFIRLLFPNSFFKIIIYDNSKKKTNLKLGLKNVPKQNLFEKSRYGFRCLTLVTH